MTKITIEDENGIYSVATHADVSVIKCLLERVVKPCLVACGYHQKLVDEYIPTGDELECYE